METLEHLYAHAIDEHELIHASNPYGCNQYGHRGGHQGGSKEQENNSNTENKKEQTQNTQTITTRAENAIADYDAFENEWDSDFGKRLRKTKYGPKMREDSGVAYEFKERIRRRLNEAKNKTSLTPEEENSLNKAIEDLEKLTKSMRQRKKRVDSETLQASAATLENEYQNLFQKQESIAAANPYGCNQYGHRKGHQGGESENPDKTTKAGLSSTDAESLTGDIFEIALEEGGFEKLYDTPKEKLKETIRKELMKSGSADMMGNTDTGDSGETAKYKWWRKNQKKIVDQL